jgi:hypothetical protein
LRLIQSAVVAAFHGAQEPSFGLTVTVTPRSLPFDGTVHVSTPTSGAFAVNVYVQAIPPTAAVKACPAIVAVKVCGAVVLLAAAATVTDPLPDPVVGDSVKPPVVVAVQPAGAHPAGVALMLTTCEPPVGAKLAVAGVMANEHAEGVGVG